MNDDVLIDEALAGCSAAFGHLVRKYQDRLYNTMVHVVGSTEDARDVVQEAFVQAFVNLEGFHRTSRFYTWLYRIAFNAAITLRRRTRPGLSIDAQRDQYGGEPIDSGPAPGDGLEQQERVGLVRSAIAALTEEYRTVLVLREIEGCDYERIAEILEIPIGTVRSRLHRARLQLKEQLRHVLQPD